MRLSPDTLPRAIAGAAVPAWLVAGDEPLLVGEACDAIRAKARSQGYVGREVHFVERGFDWGELQASLRAMSLFAEQRIVELRLLSPKPGVEGAKALVAALADPSPDVLLLVITDKIDYSDRSAAWVQAFEKHGHCVDAEQLLPEQLPAWLEARMRKAGLTPEPDAVQLMAERCEGNLVAAHQEIELLRLLSGAVTVTAEMVADSVANSARYHVFQLGESLLGGDTARTVRILDGLAADGEGLPLVLWCIAEEIRSVLQWTGGNSYQGPMRLRRGGKRRSALLARAAQRVPRPVALELLTAAARADSLVKGSGKAEAWGEVTRIATAFCIAGRNRSR
jgi:DNA polymerase-3 subunit delta